VIGHQAKGITAPILLFDFLAEEIQEQKPVTIIQKNFRARVPAGGQVIESPGKLQAKRAGHGGNLAGTEVQSQELTPRWSQKNAAGLPPR